MRHVPLDAYGCSPALRENERATLGSPIASWRVVAFSMAIARLRSYVRGDTAHDMANGDQLDALRNMFATAASMKLTLTSLHDILFDNAAHTAMAAELMAKSVLGRWSARQIFCKEERTIIEIGNAFCDALEVELTGDYVHIVLESPGGAFKRWTTRSSANTLCREESARRLRKAERLEAEARGFREDAAALLGMALSYEAAKPTT